MYGSGRHRHRAGADIGFAAHAFCHREGALKQFVEQQPQRTGSLGRAHRLFELAQNLRLAHHHGIESARHAKRMLDRARLRQLVKIRLNQRRLDLVIGRHPVDGDTRIIGVAVDFSAIAGRNNRRFLHRTPRHQIIQRPHQALGVKNHLLAHVQRSRLMVQAYGKKLHVAAGDNG